MQIIIKDKKVNSQEAVDFNYYEEKKSYILEKEEIEEKRKVVNSLGAVRLRGWYAVRTHGFHFLDRGWCWNLKKKKKKKKTCKTGLCYISSVFYKYSEI